MEQIDQAVSGFPGRADQPFVREQAAERRDALLVLRAFHQIVRPVFPPGGRILRHHLQDLLTELFPNPGILVPVRVRLRIAAGRIVQPHLHLVVLQQGPGGDTLRVQTAHHVESLLVQAGRNQAESRGATGLHPRVGELRRGRQPGHFPRIGIGRIILVALVFLIERPREIVSLAVIQRTSEPSPQLRDPSLLLRVILILLRQFRVQFVQPRLSLLPSLQGEHKKKQRDDMDQFSQHAASYLFTPRKPKESQTSRERLANQIGAAQQQGRLPCILWRFMTRHISSVSLYVVSKNALQPCGAFLFVP